MAIPIRKVKEEFEVKANDSGFDLNILIPFLNNSPSLIGSFHSESDKKLLTGIWKKSEIIDSDTIKVADDISKQDISLLKAKGLVDSDGGDTISFTEYGKKILKESILGEESSFTKTASKQMISCNSYDFGKDVLVKVQHPKNFGAKYINIAKSSFAKKNIIPMQITDYKICTAKKDGTPKEFKDYTDEELIKVLHMAKKVLNNTSKIALAAKQPIPIHRIKAFSEMIMEEINKEYRF